MGGGQGFWLQSLMSPLGFMLDLLQKLLWTILLSTFLLQPYRRYCFPAAMMDFNKRMHRKKKPCDMQTVLKRLAVLYLHRRAWSNRTTSLGPTRRHCPPPACCSEWQCRCPCSSCTCKTNSHPRPRGASSANRKVIIKYLRKLTLFCFFYMLFTWQRLTVKKILIVATLILVWLSLIKLVPWSGFHVWEDQWSEESPFRFRSHIPTPRPSLWLNGILGIHYPRSERTVRMPCS